MRATLAGACVPTALLLALVAAPVHATHLWPCSQIQVQAVTGNSATITFRMIGGGGCPNCVAGGCGACTQCSSIEVDWGDGTQSFVSSGAFCCGADCEDYVASHTYGTWAPLYTVTVSSVWCLGASPCCDCATNSQNVGGCTTWVGLWSPTPTITQTFTISPTRTDSPTITPTSTISGTSTESGTPTATPTITATATLTGTRTRTASVTATRSATATVTATATPTAFGPGQGLAVAPNPVSGRSVIAHVWVQDNSTVTVEAWNAALQPMGQFSGTGGPGFVAVTMDISSWGAGVYVLRADSRSVGSGRVTRHGPAKLAVER